VNEFVCIGKVVTCGCLRAVDSHVFIQIALYLQSEFCNCCMYLLVLCGVDSSLLV
jgi:hypothetical protein